MLQRVSKLSIVAKSALVVVVMNVLVIAVITTAVVNQLSQETRNRVIASQEMSLRAVATIFSSELEGLDVTWSSDGQVERLTIDEIPEFASHEIIDRVGRLTGETATIFAWRDAEQDFLRVTTNIVKGDGSRAVGTFLGQGGKVYPVLTEGETFRGEAVILGVPYYTIYAPIFSPTGDVLGILYAGVQKERIDSALWSLEKAIAVVAGIMTAISIAAGIFIFRRMLFPVKRLAEVVHDLAGDEEIDQVPYTSRGDEIGNMARAMEVFREAREERTKLLSEQDRQRGEADSRQLAVDKLIGEFRETATGVITHLSERAGDMQSTAQALTGVAEATSGRATAASAASEEASSNVQTVASAAEELSASIEEIAQQIGKTTEVVQKANTVTEDTNQKVGGLAEAAQRIGDVVSLIQDIAEQTNLLALNATIEAARAGELGKGFAVVASEVKELAGQTAKATEEIGQQVASIQSSTNGAVEAIGMIAEIMGEVDQFTAAIAASVEQQGSATGEISRNVQQAAVGTREVAENVSGVTASIDETSQAASQVFSASHELNDSAERLKEEVGTFLSRVAAA